MKVYEMCGHPLSKKEIEAGTNCCQECEDHWNND